LHGGVVTYNRVRVDGGDGGGDSGGGDGGGDGGGVNIAYVVDAGVEGDK